MTIAYFGYPLSDNIIRREDGSIVCLDCVLGRTGFQEYRVGDLPQEKAADLGIDTSDPGLKIKLYRSPEEVFSSAFLHSVEASPVTDDHPPNGDFVDPENFPRYAKGHVQNVRAGSEPLDDGNYPIMGDIVIAAEPLLSEVLEKRKREISLGYDYRIDRDGDVVMQVGMIANHTAIVPKGRAGSEARINDSAPADIEVPVAEPEPAKEEVPTEPKPALNVNHQPKAKESKPMKLSLKSLFGRGLIQLAKEDNADPEQLADAALELSRSTKGSARANDAEHEEERSEDRRADDRRADDRRTDDRHADDRRSDDRHADDRRTDDRHSDDRRTGDEDDDMRTRMHQQLDRMMDSRSRRTDDRHSQDTDMNELRSLMDEFGDEPQQHEQQEEGEEFQEDADLLPEESMEEGEGEVIEPVGDELGEVACEAEVVRVGDVEGFQDASGFHPIRNSEGYKRGKGGDPRKKRARDARARDASLGGYAVLQALKPLVARSSDSALRKGFNAQMRRVKGRSFDTTGGGYQAVADATRDHTRARDSQGEKGKTGDDLNKVREFYANAHNKRNAEVK